MSIRLLGLIDEINWIKVKELYPDLTNGSMGLIRTIAWRQGEKPPYAVYISQKEWIETTGFPKSTFYDYLEPLVKYKIVTQLKKGSNTNSTRAHYQFNETVLSSLPKRNKVRYSGQTNSNEYGGTDIEVLNTAPRSTAERTSESGMVEAKRNKLQETKLNELTVRFDNLIRASLPKHLAENITPSKELDALLDELLDSGVSRQAIVNKLTSHNWQGLERSAYTTVIKLLKELTMKDLNMDTPKEVCSVCGGSGSVDYAWEIFRGDGARTRSCPECSVKGKENKRNIYLYGNEPRNPIAELGDSFGMPD